MKGQQGGVSCCAHGLWVDWLGLLDHVVHAAHDVPAALAQVGSTKEGKLQEAHCLNVMLCTLCMLFTLAQVGFTKEGKLQALEIDFFCNAGNSLDLSHSIMDRLGPLDLILKFLGLAVAYHPEAGGVRWCWFESMPAQPLAPGGLHYKGARA